MKYAVCISNRDNGVKFDVSVFFTVAFCLGVEFKQSGIAFEVMMTDLTRNVIYYLLYVIYFLRPT